MKRIKKYWFVIPLAVFAAWLYASLYTADPIEATIVDSQTGEPIAGVVVVAHWQLRSGGFPETQQDGQLEVQESVSDAEGKIHFPGFWLRFSAKQMDRSSDPELILFKPDYLPRKLGTGRYESPRRKSFKGAELKLQKVDPSEQLFRDAFTGINLRVSFVASHRSSPCEWKRMPRMIYALHQQQQLNRQLGVSTTWLYNELMANEEAAQKDGCGSVREFFLKEHIE